MFSKACEYGIRSAIYVTQQSLLNNRASLKEIADKIDSPVAFTAKILQKLAQNDIVHSVKGPTGGFEIDRKKMEKIKLSQIVMAIDGDSIYKGCGLGLHECNAKKPCSVHFRFVKIRNELKTMLETTSIYELSLELDSGLAFLKR